MGRGIFAVLIAAMSFAACSSFDAGDSTTETGGLDAGSDTSSQPSTDAGVGTPLDAAPDSAGLTFCMRTAGALFCDDFEQPGRTVNTDPSPWDAFQGDGKGTLSIASGFASRSGLRVRGAFGDGEARLLQKILPIAGQKTRWSFRLRVIKLDAVADAGSPQVAISGFQFANGKYLTYVLFRQSDQLRGLAAWNLAGEGGAASFATPPVGLRFGDWLDMRIEYEPKSGNDEFRLYVGAEELSKLRLDPEASSTLALGLSGRGEGAEADVAFDDVVVETF